MFNPSVFCTILFIKTQFCVNMILSVWYLIFECLEHTKALILNTL